MVFGLPGNGWEESARGERTLGGTAQPGDSKLGPKTASRLTDMSRTRRWELGLALMGGAPVLAGIIWQAERSEAASIWSNTLFVGLVAVGLMGLVLLLSLLPWMRPYAHARMAWRR